jgi:pilus assembly protein CpaE
MLRGVIISPDSELSATLQDAVEKTHRVGIVRALKGYPGDLGLGRFLRTTAPEVVFLGMANSQQALTVAESIEAHVRGLQIVAFSRTVQREALIETMRAGIREFLGLPFEAEAVEQMITRVAEIVERKPPAIESTERVLSFLPSKPGVGCSTIALNTSIMLAQLTDTKTLLADFDLNCGMIAFMLQLDATHSVVTAVENAHQMDETLWPKLVVSLGELDLLPAGKLAPGHRIDGLQIGHLIEFARRHYQAICLDLSGILEKYSVELLHESKEIFLVCTPEVPSLHLAREKLHFLRSLGLETRVKLLLNRAQRHSLIPSIGGAESSRSSGIHELPQRLSGRSQSPDVGQACQPVFRTGREIWRTRRRDPEWGSTEAANETRLAGHAPATQKADDGAATQRT